jgi:hypothetical protein
MAEQKPKEQLKDRDRVVVQLYGPGSDAIGPDKPIEGILISMKEGKAYVLPDGRKTINMYDEKFVTKAPDVPDTTMVIEEAMLTYLRAKYSAQGPSDIFNPVKTSKLECIDYLTKHTRAVAGGKL